MVWGERDSKRSSTGTTSFYMMQSFGSAVRQHLCTIALVIDGANSFGLIAKDPRPVADFVLKAREAPA